MKTRFAFALLIFVCCSGNVLGQGNWLWAKSDYQYFGNWVEGYSVTSDQQGNAILTGTFQGDSILFSPFNLLGCSSNGSSLFVVKYNAAGNVLWVRNAYSGGVVGLSVASDSSDNIVVTGNYSYPTTFDSITFFSNYCGGTFLVKYDSNGNVKWSKEATSTNFGYDTSNSVCANKRGDVFITGICNSPVMHFENDSITNSGGSDIFIAKYDSSGNFQWVRAIGGANRDLGFSVSADTLGNVVATGFFCSPFIIFGSDTLINNASPYGDIFIVKYDSNGNEIWAKSFGGTDEDEGFGISCDATGNIYATGFFNGSTISIDSYVISNPGGAFHHPDAYIAKFDPNGNLLWATSPGGGGYVEGYSISAGPKGYVYVSGFYYQGNVIFGPLTVPYPANSTDPMWIAEYDSNGNVLCASGLGSGADDFNSVSCDPYGNAFVGGDFYISPFIVGTTTLTLTGIEDAFVAKYVCNNGVSISETMDDHSFAIFPNPSNGNFTIKNNFSENYQIEIFNSIGQEIFQREKLNESIFEIDLGNQPKGIYFVQLISDGKIHSQKIVKE